MPIHPILNRATIVGRAMQKWRPATGVEENQGDPYAYLPGVQEQFQVPADPGINYKGWINPYRMTSYQVAVPTTNPIQAIPGNLRRAYLIVQNLGPGNLYVNFGTDAVIGTCMVMVQTQFYEQIGGGTFDYDRMRSVPNAFVSPQYVSLISDAALTFAIITEGIWTFTPSEVNR